MTLGRLVNGRLIKDGWSKDDWSRGRLVNGHFVKRKVRHHHIFVYSEKAGRQTASPQETVIYSI